MRKHSTLFISILCVVFITVSCRRTHTRNKEKHTKSETIVQANPILSTETSPEQVVTVSEKQFAPPKSPSKEEILLHRTAYELSYNTKTSQPNRVEWHLTAEHTDGPYGRLGNFHEDEKVPEPRTTLQDYRGSGWSRGHMCPVGDNKWDADAMYDTFSLINVCPQNASLNSGLWNSIEMDCRVYVMSSENNFASLAERKSFGN